MPHNEVWGALAEKMESPEIVSGPGSSFATQSFQLTDYTCQLFCCVTGPFTMLPLLPGVLGSKSLVLDEEEAVYEVNCPGCGYLRSRRPYGELGSVDVVRCCMCWGLQSNITTFFGAPMPIFVGSGCEKAVIEELATELQRRMRARGDTGQIRLAERNYELLQLTRAELRLVREAMDR